MTSTDTVWVVPNDPEKREHPTRDHALARAWELTPPGGHRAEPREQAARPKIMELSPTLFIPDDIGEFQMEITSAPAFNAGVRIITSVVNVAPDVDLNRDGALIRRKILTAMRQTAQDRDMILIHETFETTGVRHEASGITIHSVCRAREKTPSDRAAEKVATMSEKYKEPSEPISRTGAAMEAARKRVAEEALKSDEAYRMLKKALTAGILSAEELEALMSKAAE